MAMSQLTPGKAEVVYLHDAFGHQLPEIASALGISVAAAQSRLVRGRKEIVRHLRSTDVAEGASSSIDADPAGLAE